MSDDANMDLDGGPPDDGATPQEIAEAKANGWADSTRWRGDPADFVGAKEFLRRGKEVIPIVRAQNSKLLNDLSEAQRQIAALKGTVDQQTQTMRDLMEQQASEIRRQVEDRLKELKADKRQAIKDGDHERAAELEDQIDETKEALEKKPVAKAPAAAPSPPAPQVEPWAQAFADANKDWLQTDKKKTALFMGICEELYESTSLRQTALLEKAKEQMEEILSPPRNRSSKSEGGNGGWNGKREGGDGPSADGKGFADLPPEAKAVARADAKRFVGKLPDIKTEADYHAYYAKTYFESRK